MKYALLLFLPLVACNPQRLEDEPCPPDTTLTYESFGKPFMDAYCIRCHGGGESYSSHSFESLASIREHDERIFAVAAGTNVSMPPGPDDPTDETRQRLAEWLACGAP